MTEKILINARIIDPSQDMDEKGSVVVDKNGKIKSIGKNFFSHLYFTIHFQTGHSHCNP